jgi:hypothetical protein
MSLKISKIADLKTLSIKSNTWVSQGTVSFHSFPYVWGMLSSHALLFFVMNGTFYIKPLL